MNETSTMTYAYTIGIDLGDTRHQFCMLRPEGTIEMEGKLDNHSVALQAMFATLAPSLVALEAGTHSPWIAAALEGWGHTVLVANPSELAAITKSQKKSDQRDARMLAKLARVDPELLRPLRHRSAQAQTDLALLKARHALVKVRSTLIGHCRGDRQERRGAPAQVLGRELPQAAGSRAGGAARGAGAAAAPGGRAEPEDLAVGAQDRGGGPGALPREQAPGGAGQRGPVDGAVASCWWSGMPSGSRKAARWGPTWGWRPKRISRAGAGWTSSAGSARRATLAVLLVLAVQCAQHLLSRRGKDCELRRWGLKLCERGGKAAKKRAVIATARKLAVQLHALWAGPEAYPIRSTPPRSRPSAGVAEVKRRGRRAPWPERRGVREAGERGL